METRSLFGLPRLGEAASLRARASARDGPPGRRLRMPVIDRRKVSAAALSRLSAEPVVREHAGAQLLAAVERGRLLDAARRESSPRDGSGGR